MGKNVKFDGAFSAYACKFLQIYRHGVRSDLCTKRQQYEVSRRKLAHYQIKRSNPINKPHKGIVLKVQRRTNDVRDAEYAPYALKFLSLGLKITSVHRQVIKACSLPLLLLVLFAACLMPANSFMYQGKDFESKDFRLDLR